MSYTKSVALLPPSGSLICAAPFCTASDKFVIIRSFSTSRGKKGQVKVFCCWPCRLLCCCNCGCCCCCNCGCCCCWSGLEYLQQNYNFVLTIDWTLGFNLDCVILGRHVEPYNIKVLHEYRSFEIVRCKTYPRSVSLGLIDTLASREGMVSFIFDAREFSGKPGHWLNKLNELESNARGTMNSFWVVSLKKKHNRNYEILSWTKIWKIITSSITKGSFCGTRKSSCVNARGIPPAV